MKTKFIRQPKIRVAIAEDDPLRLIGIRALLESEQDLELQTVSLTKTKADFEVDVLLLTEPAGHRLADEVEKAKVAFPGARVLATGPSLNEKVILHSISLGAKGY